MRRLISLPSERTSIPSTSSRPDVVGETHWIILMAVDLPAPFGPRRPKISPFPMARSIWSTATRSPYFLTRSLATTTGGMNLL